MNKIKKADSASYYQIPDYLQESWQNLANVIVNLEDVKATLILRIDKKNIEILISSENEDNPYEAGEVQEIRKGLYFEPVIRNKAELIVSNALSNDKWKARIETNKGMIACICLPIYVSEGESFGELCILDDKVHKFSNLQIELLHYFRELLQYQLNSVRESKKVIIEKEKFRGARISDELPHFLHICSFCKRIKDKHGKWISMEEFFSRYIDILFSHGICPKCLDKHYGYIFKRQKNNNH